MRAARWAGRGLFIALGLLLLVRIAWLARNWSEVSQVTTRIGSEAPPFDLELLGGGRATLAGARGHALVLSFWASWCEPCKVELPTLDALARKHPDVRFLAVNIEEPSMRPRVEAFVNSTGLALPVAVGGGPTSSRYQVETIPHLVLVDAQGRVAQVVSGLRSESSLERAIEAAAAKRP